MMRRICNRYVLGWSVVALLLAALGWALHATLPPAPRWAARGPIVPLGFTADGKAYATAVMPLEDLPNMNRSPRFPSPPRTMGTVQFWDIATGQPTCSVLTDVAPRWQIAFSEDRRQLAAIGPPFAGSIQDELRLIDPASGREQRAMVEHRKAGWHVAFSPGGALLVLDDWDRHPNTHDLYLFDTSTLRLVGKARPRDRLPRYFWIADGKALLVRSTDEHGNVAVRRLTAESDTTIPLQGAGDWLAVTPDGKTLLTEPPRNRLRGRPKKGNAPIDAILVWDLPSGKQRGAIAVDGFRPWGVSDNLLITEDSRTLLITMGKRSADMTLGVWDLDAAAWLGKVSLAGETQPLLIKANTFVLRHPQLPAPFAGYRVRPFARLWQRTIFDARPRAIHYLPDADRLVVMFGDAGESRLEMLDPQTGQATFALPLDPRGSHGWLSEGSKFALVTYHGGERGVLREFIEEHVLTLLHQRGEDFPVATQFFNVPTGVELARIDHTGSGPTAITPDGRGFIVYRQAGTGGEAAVICYDVPPRRPWRWIAGIPLALGATLLTVRFGWRRIRPSRSRLPGGTLARSRPAGGTYSHAGGSLAQDGSAAC